MTHECPGPDTGVVTNRTAPRAALAGVAALALVASATAHTTTPTTQTATPTTPAVQRMLADRHEHRASRDAGRELPPGPTVTDPRPARRLERAVTRPAGHPPRRAAPRRTLARHQLRSRAVVGFARAQIGDPYIRNAAGPYGFDCSGLTMRSYARAGVRLPHKASRQSVRGKRVARSSARAGDLVFWGGVGNAYHVGIYLGGGRVVHSPRPGRQVSAAPLWGRPQFRRLL